MNEGIGAFMRIKFRIRARQYGYFATAKALRKQGIPLEMALLLLVK